MVLLVRILPFLLPALGIAALLAVTGWWRVIFMPLRISPRRMTVETLGLKVHDRDRAERVNQVLATFLQGFNKALTARTLSDGVAYCQRQPLLFQPFAHEGLAMGYVPRRLLRYRADEFERDVVRAMPAFRYLYYVGLGFWSGMRNHAVGQLARVVDGLDPLHGFLCYDGYGFKTAFFDYPKDEAALQRLDALEGYARHAAYQGVGRAFFFLFMDEPDALLTHMERLGPHAADAAAGAGLAAVFVFPDQLAVAQALGWKLPPALRPAFHLGMCFGCKARSINHLEQFEDDLARQPAAVRDSVWAGIRACDRIELLVRDERPSDGYRQWRMRVTEWLTENVAFPMAGVRERGDGSSVGGIANNEGQAIRAEALIKRLS